MKKHSANWHAAQPYLVAAERITEPDGSSYYMAFHPELDGCMTDGDSLEAAIDNLADARLAYIESLLEDGITPPAPTIPGRQREEARLEKASVSFSPEQETGQQGDEWNVRELAVAYG